MGKSKSILATKFIIGFIIIGVIICSVSSIVGCYQFKSSIKNVYLEKAANIVKQTRLYFNIEEISSYVDLIKRSINGENVEAEFEAVQNSESYQETLSKLKKLRTSMEVRDIYLVYFDKNLLYDYEYEKEEWLPFNFIFDSYYIEEYSFNFGYKGVFNPSFLDIVKNVAENGIKYDGDKHIISKDSISVFSAVPAGDDNLILCSDIPMKIVQNTVIHYILSAVLVSIALIAIVIYIYMAYLSKKSY